MGTFAHMLYVTCVQYENAAVTPELIIVFIIGKGQQSISSLHTEVYNYRTDRCEIGLDVFIPLRITLNFGILTIFQNQIVSNASSIFCCP